MPNCTEVSPGCCESRRRTIVVEGFELTNTHSRENDITDVIDDTFCTTEERFGEIVTVDLKPGGRDVQVTEDNKKEYVDLVTTYRIEKRVSEQFEAFMSGFNELIPQELINVFDERELEVSRWQSGR